LTLTDFRAELPRIFAAMEVERSAAWA